LKRFENRCKVGRGTLKQEVARMIAAEPHTRNDRAGEHLQLLRSLSAELERAMRAIAGNHLAELEDSVANQQALSLQLGELADEMRASALAPSVAVVDTIEPVLMREIRDAASELRKLNLRYSILLKYSSRSVALMAALFNSFKGQFQEAPGARLRHQTWSCRV
jgi:hypothetical protein